MFWSHYKSNQFAKLQKLTQVQSLQKVSFLALHPVYVYCVTDRLVTNKNQTKKKNKHQNKKNDAQQTTAYPFCVRVCVVLMYVSICMIFALFIHGKKLGVPELCLFVYTT